MLGDGTGLAAITDSTRVVFVETIANPRTQVADLKRIGELCKARGILYAVDNTMTTPYLLQPKSVHAGLVVNAPTKSIGGPGNALGGSLTDAGADGCPDCRAIDADPWSHLRRCLTCGHVACCDSSPHRHATAHHRDTGHPVMRSFEPGESWRWCYADQRIV